VQAAKEIIILRIEYKAPERHMGSLVVEQTAQQMLPRLLETKIRRCDSRLAHRDSETGHSFHSLRNRIGKFPLPGLLVNQRSVRDDAIQGRRVRNEVEQSRQLQGDTGSRRAGSRVSS
jgi:hypothetical protein